MEAFNSIEAAFHASPNERFLDSGVFTEGVYPHSSAHERANTDHVCRSSLVEMAFSNFSDSVAEFQTEAPSESHQHHNLQDLSSLSDFELQRQVDY